MARNKSGFTLLEVMVALAIVAIALGAAVRLSGEIVTSSFDIRQRQFGRWIAQNRLNLHLASNDWPALGTVDGEDTMGGEHFRWQETVSSTPNIHFRRIEVRVFSDDEPDFALASLIGYVHESQN